MIFMARVLSNCICLQTPDIKKARTLYEKGFGGSVVNEDEETIELQSGPLRIFLDRGEPMGPILEILVKDVELAREELLRAGWTQITWEGRGNRCYMRDPLGFVFNLFEDSTPL